MVSGWIDVAQRDRVAGWAADARGRPVMLEILVAPTLRAPARTLARCLANRYRADRDADGSGTAGRNGFDLDLARYDLPSTSFLLDIRDTLTATRLPAAPHFMQAASFTPPAVPLLLTELHGNPAWRLPDDVVTCQPRHDGRLRVDLPPGAAGVMICPRVRLVPGDARRLGAVVSRLTLDDQPIDLDHPALAFGFHALEGEAGCHWRWIDDAAFIPVAAPGKLEVDLRAVLPAPDHDPWHLSAAYRMVSPSLASVPYVGSRPLAPSISPARQQAAIRPRCP